MAEKKYHQLSQEERERQRDEYIESQDPIEREDPAELNEFGQHVPAPEGSQKVDEAPKPPRKTGRKGGRK